MDKDFARLARMVGDKVRSLRQTADISQEELAAQADIDRTYVSQIERGVGNPSLFVLNKIARVLGTSILELFD